MAVIPVATIPEALTLALQHHQAGRLQQAEALYRQILQVAPDHPEVLHRLGVLAHQRGEHAVAVRLIQQAIGYNPHEARFHNNLGAAYQALEKLEEAEAQYRKALALRTDYAEAYKNLGNVLKEQGKLEEAISHYQHALALRTNYPEVHCNLGSTLKELGNLDEAVVHYRQALALRPSFPEAHNNLGVALAEQGLLGEAIVHYHQALVIRPEYAEACYNLGNALKAQGELRDAVTQYQKALNISPDYAEAHTNLAAILQGQGRLEVAAVHARQALALRPTDADAYFNLGIILQEQGSLEESRTMLQQALALKPGHAEAHTHLGLTLQDLGQREEAILHYRKALELKPDYVEAENQLMHQRQRLCDWEGLEALFDRQRVVLREQPSANIPPFTILSFPTSPAEQLLCARNWVANCLAPVARRGEGLAFDFPRTPKARLRVGYLSPDFRQHPVAALVVEVFGLHDRTRFEVVGYSYGPEDGSALRKRIVQGCDRFVDIRGNSFQEAAQRINGDGIDILVDLTGYTRWARTHILALRPAPIQVSYLGYGGTMGGDFIDYIITDRFTTPPDQQAYFTERLVYLPDCYQVNDRQRPIADQTPIREECGLPEPGFVFCCFNNTYKITPAIFEVWMRLLRDVPGSVLWLLATNPRAVANLRREATVRGTQPGRLVFGPHLPQEQHLARLRLADLFLDTLPVNAGATASDALWAGLPLLTCVGGTMVSRVAGSLLTAAGLPELITYSLEEYEALALHLALHPKELTELRGRLAKNRLTAPLFDTPRFTRHLERAYEMMWNRYLQGLSPGPIEVPALEH
jgi:predicted O-linked N-acetylglucosamine transferase (SPINDLY family)